MCFYQMSRTPELPNGFHDEDFQDKARHASDNKECIRLLGLAFIQKGLSEKEVANLLKVNPRSVFDWLQRYKQGGAEALKDQGGRGRKNSKFSKSAGLRQDTALQSILPHHETTFFCDQ